MCHIFNENKMYKHLHQFLIKSPGNSYFLVQDTID